MQLQMTTTARLQLMEMNSESWEGEGEKQSSETWMAQSAALPCVETTTASERQTEGRRAATCCCRQTGMKYSFALQTVSKRLFFHRHRGNACGLVWSGKFIDLDCMLCVRFVFSLLFAYSTNQSQRYSSFRNKMSTHCFATNKRI